MSPAGALILAIVSLILLGAVAAWLMNVPLWAIGGLVVVAGVFSKWLVGWFSRRRARQNTESPS